MTTASATDREAFEIACRHIEARRKAMPPALNHRPESFIGRPAGRGEPWAEGEVQFVAEPAPACPECGDRGWRPVDGDPRNVERCSCRTPSYDGPESVPAAALELYGCPPKLAGLQKSTWRSPPPWPEHADLWPGAYRDEHGDMPDMLLIHGKSGNGKSRVAAWIMRRAMAAGRRCRWVAIPELMARCLRAIGDEEAQRTIRGEVENWIGADLVILDDVAKHQDSDYQTLGLFNDWLRRLENGPGLVVGTANKSPRELVAWEGSIASRLLSGPVIELTGRDARKKEWRRVR